MSEALNSVLRIREALVAGKGLRRDDQDRLAFAFEQWISGVQFEVALGLERVWRTSARKAMRAKGLAVPRGEGPNTSARARAMQSDLQRVARKYFRPGVQRLPRPEGTDGDLYDILVAFNGDKPSLRTLRRWFSTR